MNQQQMNQQQIQQRGQQAANQQVVFHWQPHKHSVAQDRKEEHGYGGNARVYPTVLPHTKNGVARRSGKWLPEEEDYVRRIITYFNTGWLKIPVRLVVSYEA